MPGRLSVVCGGQFGSEAKGHLVADLAAQSTGPGLSVVRVAGPNAGHSAVGTDGKTWALRQIPVAAVVRPDAVLWIAAGSEVDVSVLLTEVRLLDEAGFNVSGRLFIDGSATLLIPDHIAAETDAQLTGRIGSTGKGIGAARASRIMRTAATVRDTPELSPWVPDLPVAEHLMDRLRMGHHVIIEGTQGYGLGLHTWFYPKATSSDCRAIDFLAMVGLSPWATGCPAPEVWVVVRPYPIRVAGASGPLKDETTWDELGLPVEMTTVTRKPRRVGKWDQQLVRDAVAANGGNVKLAFSMADQVVPSVAGAGGPYHYDDNTDLDGWITRVEQAAGDGSLVEWIGTGPGTSMRVELGTVVRDPDGLEQQLTAWWLDLAETEVKRVVPKAVEYGSGDLLAIGEDLARLSRLDLTDAQKVELGIVFYTRGKMARIQSGIESGGWPSDDSWHDLGVYARMVQRVRSTGRWT